MRNRERSKEMHLVTVADVKTKRPTAFFHTGEREPVRKEVMLIELWIERQRFWPWRQYYGFPQ